MFSNEIIIATLGMILPPDHWYIFSTFTWSECTFCLRGPSTFMKRQTGGSLLKTKQNMSKGGNGERL